MPNKDLNTFAAQNSMLFDAKRNLVYGRLRGYDMTVTSSSKNEALATMNVESANADSAEMLSQFLYLLPKSHPCVAFAHYQNRTVTVGMRGSGAAGVSAFSAALGDVTNFLLQHGFASCCRYCGAKTGLAAYSINGKCDTMCESCFQSVSGGSAAVAQEPKKSNFGLGVVGALIGAALGCVVWVLIYQFGYIAGIAGAAMLIFAAKGYELLGGRIDVRGVILCSILSIVMLFVAVNVTMFVEVYKALKEYYYVTLSDIDFVALFRTAWADGELRRAMLADLGVGYLLAALVGVPYAMQLFKKAKYQAEAVRLPAYQIHE
ncbi:hypothetical protein [Feifania hominis]|uniref:Uncharacterized protein n=1 Tax=Feifania hominis TaxID=2763660 RepID=A0A926DDE6_9FIRM|nr:hypothetical protein [Feifania hominis]MBC8536146.1 hypothetical protein [Feifania hominis]